MADEAERGDALETQLEQLEERLGGAGAMVERFDAELARMTSSMSRAQASASTLSNSISRGLRRAFDGLVFDGKSAADALRTVSTSIANATYSAALRPITKQLGGLVGHGLAQIGAVGFADGGVFAGGRATPGAGARVRAFARGGVVSGPTTFPMRGGTGLMGEAGPEAILPLERGPDGRLGVQAGGGARPVQVVMNVSTPDVEGFRRSGGQIAAQVGRALARGQRNR
ncbi:MAG: phage tail tape measure protein [Paracoccaceae bacterium]|jgi:phage-related minor tail protein|nr:phage tail tape measure protein [Paracoccaceae bacterium]